MSAAELQEEELEVLRSIYEGEESFKENGHGVFQYKYGEDNNSKSLVVEIIWGDTYPNDMPTVNMDTFYNKHVHDSVKTKIQEGILQQAQDFLGTAMTYSLFEWVKENYEELIADQPAAPLSKNEVKTDFLENLEDPSKRKEKKEQLTKHQKRRLYEKMGNATGEQPRGWNWVDIVKHLSQTADT